ncbi:MAG: phosphatidate cytidylyltransferase, partial [Vicinamibacteria bacterium]
IAIALLLGLFWRPGSPQDAGYVGVAALMATTWGDTAAALIGRRYGTRRYRMLGHRRTMEGTLALFFVSGVAMAPVLAVMGGIDWHQSVAFALIAATIVSLIEIVSFYGSDNLTIPLAAALTLSLLTRLS